MTALLESIEVLSLNLYIHYNPQSQNLLVLLIVLSLTYHFTTQYDFWGTLFNIF